MRKLLAILFFLPLLATAQNNVYLFNAADGTPMKRYDTTITGWNARVLVPQNHDNGTDSTEVIIDIGGLGEVGTDTADLSVNGYGYWISNARWDGTVTLPSGNHHPIIIVLQPNAGWPGESTLSGKVDVILNRWKIKRRAVHLSGLSMGGWCWTTLVTSDASSPYNRAFKITSIVESGGANPNENTPYPDLFDRFATVGARGTGGKLLSFQQDLDARDALNRVNRMNSNAAGSYYIQTNFGARGHSNFNDHYNPNTTNWTTSNAEVTSTTPAGGISYSMAQWQLLQGDTTTPSSGGGSPTITANAGNDSAYIYDQGGLARTFTLSGSQSGATSPVYSWAALPGNPAATIITSSSSASTTVTGANVPGYYGYELTVTEGEASDKDTVYLQLRDLMVRGLRPCRVGQPQVFTTGISISTRATTYWYAVASATAAQSGGEETANPYYLWPQNVVLDYMFSNQTSCASGNEHIEVSGLTPLAYYTVQIMPSRNNSNVSDATRQVRYVVRHNGTRTTLAAVDAKQNTTLIAQMVNVQADASGKFWIGSYGNNENVNAAFGYFNGMQIVRQNGVQ